jgi:hypothetical protein
MCSSIGIEPTLPRLCGRQRHRSNVPAQSPLEYDRRTITVPLLDHVLSELNTRFSKHQQTAHQVIFLVPSVLIAKQTEEISPKVRELGNMFQCDLPHPTSLECEFHCWYMKWKEQERHYGLSSLPATLSHTLPHASSMFPNIRVLLVILCTLPVSYFLLFREVI